MKGLLCLLLCAIAADLRSQTFSVYILAANRANTAEIIDNSTLETLARIHFDFHVERISGAGALQLTVAGYTDGSVCCKEYTLGLPRRGHFFAAQSAKKRSFLLSRHGPMSVPPDMVSVGDRH
jgi:hypothetical protein